MNERMSPPTIAPNYRHIHLGRFSLSCARRTDTHKLRSRRPHPSRRQLHKEQYLLDQRVIMRVSRLQPIWLTLHLYAAHVILVIGVDEFTIFIILYNQMRVLPPGPQLM